MSRNSKLTPAGFELLVKLVDEEKSTALGRFVHGSAYDGAALRYTNVHGDEYHVRFTSGQYSNGRLAVQLESVEFGEPEGVLTSNFEGIEVDEAGGEIVVKTWGENDWSGLTRAALDTGWFEDTGKRVTNGFVEASIWRVLTRDEVDERAEAQEEARAQAASVMPR